VDADRARTLAERWGAEFATDDLAALLAQPGLDAVSIVTPTSPTPSPRSPRPGRQAYPDREALATTVEECERIIAACRQAGVKLMVDFHNRWNPPFHRARRAIEEGEIGTPQFASYRLSDTIYVPTKMISWAGRSTVAWFLASHCLDTPALADGDEVSRVLLRRAVAGAEGSRDRYRDFYQTTLEFRGGATAFLEVAWILPEGRRA